MRVGQRACFVAVIALGLAGLYFKVEYAGWVLIAGLLGLL